MNDRLNQIPRHWLLVAGFAIVLAMWSPVREHELPPDTPWHLLMSAEGLTGPSPVLPDTLRRLDDQSIRLTGFMYPLDQSRGQRRFLLSPYPAGCAFHMPGGPASMVEVFADESVRFTYDAVAVQGVFALAASEEGIRYQLHAATVEDLP